MAAEKYEVLVSIGIDSQVVKDSIANADRLTAEINKLRAAQKASGVQDAETTAAIKALTQERSRDLRVVQQANTLASETVKGQERLKAELSLLTVQYNKLTTEEQRNTKTGKALTAQIRAISDELKANEKAVGNNTRNVGNYESALEGLNGKLDKFGGIAGKMPGPLGAMASGIVGATRAAIAFIATPLGLVLGAVALALGAVRAAFTSSEEGQNRWNKITTIGSALLGKFTDLLSVFGEKIISVFQEPQKAIKEFAALVKDQIVNRFEGLIELVPALGEAISALFKGDFAGAGKIATDAVGKVALGVENITDKAGAAAKAVGELGKQAAEVADKRAKADIIERNLLTVRAAKEAEIAELRLKAKQEDQFTAKQRQQFLKDANAMQNGLIDAETEYLKLRKEAIVTENTFSRTNKENKDKEAEAIAALSQAETKRFEEQRSLQRELNTINKQISAEQAAAFAAKKKATEDEIKAEKERIKAIEQGYIDERDLIDQIAATKKNQAIINIANAEEQAKAIAAIDKDALWEKIKNIDDETAVYTASADFVGAVDEKKYAKQLALRAKYQADLTSMVRAEKAQAFTDEVELLGQREKLEIQAAEASIKNERDLTDAKGRIALKFLQERLAIMRQTAMLDDVLTQQEINNLKLVEGQIAKTQEKLANPDALTLAESIGLSEQDLADIQLATKVVTEVLGSVLAATQQAADNKMANIDRASSAEIAAIEKSTLSEEEKKKKITAIEKKAAKEKYKIELEQFKIAKGLQIAMAIANTATAVMAQLSAPPPAGFVLAALAAVTGGVQIGMIAAQQPPPPPAFAAGGYVSGAGSGTSDSIPAMLSNGESVNNAETTARFAPILSALNAAGGGVDWYRGEGYAKGGLVRKFAAGGIASVSSSQMRDNEQAVMMMAQMSMAQPVLVIEEFQQVQGRQVRTEQNLQL